MVRVDGVCGANIRAHGRKSSRAAEMDERDPRVDGWRLRSTLRVSKAKTLEGSTLREVIGFKQIVADIVITVES